VAFDTVPGVRPGIEALLAEDGCRHLVLDLSRVDCFDSSGLAMLLGAQRGDGCAVRSRASAASGGADARAQASVCAAA
jgi:anti-sigma B factor antagonist